MFISFEKLVLEGTRFDDKNCCKFIYVEFLAAKIVGSTAS